MDMIVCCGAPQPMWNTHLVLLNCLSPRADTWKHPPVQFKHYHGSTEQVKCGLRYGRGRVFRIHIPLCEEKKTERVFFDILNLLTAGEQWQKGSKVTDFWVFSIDYPSPSAQGFCVCVRILHPPSFVCQKGRGEKFKSEEWRENASLINWCNYFCVVGLYDQGFLCTLKTRNASWNN